MSLKGKGNTNGVYEFPYMKPPEKTTWEAICDSLYNPKDGTVLGRTGKNWAQLLIFYTIFYAVLAALFSICMKGLLATLDEKYPTWQLEKSLIGANPGLGFRPQSNRTEEGSLIWYNSRNESSIQKWIDLTNDFLKPYMAPTEGKNLVACDFDKPPKQGEVCNVNLTNFGPCSPAHSYGYKTSSPCIFLKLNRIYNWQPQFYNDPNNLPSTMPEELKEVIKNLDGLRLNQIWVSCDGENPADKEHVSNFNFFPDRGFQSYYYPYTNEMGYLSPLIAVQVIEPKPNVLVNIECRAWARNINYRGGNQYREGSVHFEILRDIQ